MNKETLPPPPPPSVVENYTHSGAMYGVVALFVLVILVLFAIGLRP